MIGSMMMAVWLSAVSAHAETGGGPTGATGDTATSVVATGSTADTGTLTTPTDPTTGGTPTTDETLPTGTTDVSGATGGTGSVPACYDCKAASDLAGDEGGTPCGDCTTGSASPWLAAIGLLGLVRRRDRRA